MPPPQPTIDVLDTRPPKRLAATKALLSFSTLSTPLSSPDDDSLPATEKTDTRISRDTNPHPNPRGLTLRDIESDSDDDLFVDYDHDDDEVEHAGLKGKGSLRERIAVKKERRVRKMKGRREMRMRAGKGGVKA
ncbi:MAG: hypothetical protein LQ338_002515 [Usnochroma carphineum]|nr:MAG: hypothetical protein LQ338_002515 [Usnochroma carphineum]